MRRIAPFVLAAVSLPLAGCVAVAAGAAAGYGAAQYVRNTDSRDYGASFDATWRAAVDAMRAQGYPVSAEAAAGTSGGRIVSNDADVAVGQWGSDRTRVTIRIGTFSTDAHRARANAIHDGISKRLPTR
jgi:hypothetical protein